MKAKEKLDMGLCCMMGCAEMSVEGTILCKTHYRFASVSVEAWPTTEYEYENGATRDENPTIKRRCGICVLNGCFNATKKIPPNQYMVDYSKPQYEPICEQCKSRVKGLPVSKW